MTSADLVSLLRRSASLHPDRVAVIGPARTLLYRELLPRVDGLAGTLPPRDPIGGEAVAVVADHDEEVPELYLGILAAGHAVVPISGRLPDDQIAYIADRANIRLGLIAPSASQRQRSISASVDSTLWLRPSEMDEVHRLPPVRGLVPPDTAMVSFTSGTTGNPKGVILTHTNILIQVLNATSQFAIADENCHINPMPLVHFAGASRVFLSICNAGTHVILPGYDPSEVLESIEAHRGTHLMMVPTMLRDLLLHEPERYDLSSLTTVIYGSAPMPLDLAHLLLERLDCGLVNAYGCTEASATATTLGPSEHRDAVRRGDDVTLSSVGRPIPGVEMRILGEDLREVDAGTVGQVALRGAKVSPGYLNDPEQTAKRFLPDGWHLTGDAAHLSDDGYLLLRGRLDDMIISGGLNIHPEEIEQHVRTYPGIAECACYGVASERWGQELRMAIVVEDGGRIEPDAVLQHLRQHVDRWKVPKVVRVVDALPKTSVGKVRRFVLAADAQ